MLPNDSVQYLPGPVVHRRGSDVTEIANSEVNFEKVSKENICSEAWRSVQEITKLNHFIF